MQPLPHASTKQKGGISKEREKQKGQGRAQMLDRQLCDPAHQAISRTEARMCWAPALKQVAEVLGVHDLQGLGTRSAPVREQPNHIHS